MVAGLVAAVFGAVVESAVEGERIVAAAVEDTAVAAGNSETVAATVAADAAEDEKPAWNCSTAELVATSKMLDDQMVPHCRGENISEKQDTGVLDKKNVLPIRVVKNEPCGMP